MDEEHGPFAALLARLRDKYREITGRDDAPELPSLSELARRRRLEIQRAQPSVADATSVYREPEQPPPVPVLNTESRRPLSDQARRLGNVMDADQGRAPAIRESSGIRAAMSNPMYNRGKFGLELLSDFSPYGMAKDLGAGVVSGLRGDLGNALGYSLATIPFLGRSLKEGVQAMKPFHPVGIFNEITPEILDPSDLGETLLFAPARYHNEAAFAMNPDRVEQNIRGQMVPSYGAKKQRRLAFVRNQGDQFAEMPALGLGPTPPESRLRILNDMGILTTPDMRDIQDHLAGVRNELLDRGWAPVDVKGLDGLQAIVEQSDLPEPLKEVLDPANPMFPGIMQLHEGRNRALHVDYVGDQMKVPENERLLPIRFRVNELTPPQLLDQPLVFRQQPYASYKTFEMLDAPFTRDRIAEQSGIARALKEEFAKIADPNDPSWERAWSSPLTIDDFADTDEVLKMPGGREAVDQADRAMDLLGHRYSQAQHYGLGMEPDAVRGRDAFLDYIYRTLSGKRPDAVRRPINLGDAGIGLGDLTNYMRLRNMSPENRVDLRLDWFEANRDAQIMPHFWASTYPEFGSW